jgi:hypothetical protein
LPAKCLPAKHPEPKAKVRLNQSWGRSLEDPRHILRVATALAKTIDVQHEIDALYPQVEENLIKFNL